MHLSCNFAQFPLPQSSKCTESGCVLAFMQFPPNNKRHILHIYPGIFFIEQHRNWNPFEIKHVYSAILFFKQYKQNGRMCSLYIWSNKIVWWFPCMISMHDFFKVHPFVCMFFFRFVKKVMKSIFDWKIKQLASLTVGCPFLLLKNSTEIYFKIKQLSFCYAWFASSILRTTALSLFLPIHSSPFWESWSSW